MVDLEKDRIRLAEKGVSLDGGRLEVFNRDDFLKRVGGREELVEKFLVMFAGTVEKSLAELVRAEPAITLDEAAKIMHSLKGAAANIAAERIHAVVVELEKLAKSGDRDGFSSGLEQLVWEHDHFRKEMHV